MTHHEHPFRLKFLHAVTLGLAIAALVVAIVGFCKCGDCCKDGSCCPVDENVPDADIVEAFKDWPKMEDNRASPT